MQALFFKIYRHWQHSILFLTNQMLHCSRHSDKPAAHNGEVSARFVRVVQPGHSQRGLGRGHQQEALARDYQGAAASLLYYFCRLYFAHSVSIDFYFLKQMILFNFRKFQVIKTITILVILDMLQINFLIDNVQYVKKLSFTAAVNSRHALNSLLRFFFTFERNSSSYSHPRQGI